MGVAAATGSKPLLLTVKEATALLGVGRTTLYELARSSGLPMVRIGSRGIRIPADGLADWVKRNTRICDADGFTG